MDINIYSRDGTGYGTRTYVGEIITVLTLSIFYQYRIHRCPSVLLLLELDRNVV
jgi:hypothetical protein